MFNIALTRIRGLNVAPLVVAFTLFAALGGIASASGPVVSAPSAVLADGEECEEGFTFDVETEECVPEGKGSWSKGSWS